MSDQCKHYECYGRFDLCERTECFVRESWYSLTLQMKIDSMKANYLAALEASAEALSERFNSQTESFQQTRALIVHLEAVVKDFENSNAGMLRAVNEGLVEESKILVEQITVLKGQCSNWKASALQNQQQIAALITNSVKYKAFWEWSKKTDRMIFEQDWGHGIFKQPEEEKS